MCDCQTDCPPNTNNTHACSRAHAPAGSSGDATAWWHAPTAGAGAGGAQVRGGLCCKLELASSSCTWSVGPCLSGLLCIHALNVKACQIIGDQHWCAHTYTDAHTHTPQSNGVHHDVCTYTIHRSPQLYSSGARRATTRDAHNTHNTTITHNTHRSPKYGTAAAPMRARRCHSRRSSPPAPTRCWKPGS